MENLILYSVILDALKPIITSKAKWKLILYLFVFSPVFLMGQTYHYRNWDVDSSKAQTIFTQNLVYKDLMETRNPCLEYAKGFIGWNNCTHADTAKPIGPEYFNTNIGIDRYVKTRRKFDLNYGIIVQLEQYRNPEAGYYNYRYNLYPFIGLDGKKAFGFRVGFRLGNMFDGLPEKKSTTPLLPAGRFWFGVKNDFTFQMGIFDSDIAGPFDAPLDLRFNMNLSRFTKNRMGQFGLGISFIEGYASYYGQTEIYIKQRVALTPRFGMTFSNFRADVIESGFLGGLGLRYDLNVR